MNRRSENLSKKPYLPWDHSHAISWFLDDITQTMVVHYEVDSAGTYWEGCGGMACARGMIWCAELDYPESHHV